MSVGDLNAMFEQANHLPADDPLRAASCNEPASMRVAADGGSTRAAFGAKAPNRLTASEGLRRSRRTAASAGAAMRGAPQLAPLLRRSREGSVMVDAGQRVAVPSFTGSALRGAVETAAGLGLRVAPVGSGVAREQMPAAGTHGAGGHRGGRAL